MIHIEKEPYWPFQKNIEKRHVYDMSMRLSMCMSMQIHHTSLDISTFLNICILDMKEAQYRILFAMQERNSYFVCILYYPTLGKGKSSSKKYPFWRVYVFSRRVNLFSVTSKSIGSMYGIFTYIYHRNQLNVGKYTIHGSYGKHFGPLQTGKTSCWGSQSFLMVARSCVPRDVRSGDPVVLMVQIPNNHCLDV